GGGEQPALLVKLIRAYAACGDLCRARLLFDSVPGPLKNTVFFNVMIRSYVSHRRPRDALRLLSSMSPGPDHYTYPCALKACSDAADLPAGRQLHAAVARLGLDANLFVANALITMYARCGRSDRAFQVFAEMPRRDVVSWNAIIAGFARERRFDRSIAACREMAALRGPAPDAGTLASVLPAMADAAPADIGLARHLFDEMPAKGPIAWNAMIAIYSNNSMAKEAVGLFARMEAAGPEPDALTLASVLPACGQLSAFGLGKRIHEIIKRKGMRPNMVLENALMDMYANCGCLADARDVFDGMRVRDVVSWTSIISAYGTHGRGKEAIALFEKMRESGVEPDSIAFVSLLAACSHAGLLEEGRRYFRSMTNKYRIVPRIEHYACMVDLLGRAGCIEEAYAFITKMPIRPNDRVWGALLGACRVHSNMEIGLLAADELFRLVPEQSGYYVLLSNIYARAGRWEEVTSVRSVMADKGIKKVPGCSNVELGSKVHTFHVGDQSHPQSKMIYRKLDVLLGRMKELGYVAATESALHDVEEEDKESHLTVHSEKLAIAFVLINTGRETPVRITMNLRICGDCHHFAKLVSTIAEREIIIKDTNRFHHIENGVCSCRDYW
ncbi:putative pentatricopeptide repeat-containing protein, partial [Ananas comosus]